MKEIPLTQGKAALVDDADYEWLMQWKWHFGASGYAIRCVRKGGRQTIRLHRIIINAPNGMEVDHINRDRLDCRRSNLRVVSRAQNQHNAGKHTRKNQGACSSQYKGVSWRKARKVWVAGIGLNRKWIYLGFFNSEIEAARAYDDAACIYHGDFARLNFPADSANRGVSE